MKDDQLIKGEKKKTYAKKILTLDTGLQKIKIQTDEKIISSAATMCCFFTSWVWLKCAA